MSASEKVIEMVINKVSDAIGIAMDPYGIRDCKKNFIDEIGKYVAHMDNLTPIQKGELMQEFYLSFAKNKNRKLIVGKSLDSINKNSNPKNVEDSWILNFWDKAGSISDDSLQSLWGRILAQEINEPNTISKRLLHNMSLMSKKDAENFTNFARFCFGDINDDIQHPLIFIKEHGNAYAGSKITTKMLNELESYSLIETNYDSGFSYFNKKVLTYQNHIIDIRADRIKSGNIRLSDDGQMLIKIVPKLENDKIFEYAIEILQYNNCTISIRDKH